MDQPIIRKNNYYRIRIGIVAIVSTSRLLTSISIESCSSDILPTDDRCLFISFPHILFFTIQDKGKYIEIEIEVEE